eukprot:gene10092-18742_t
MGTALIKLIDTLKAERGQSNLWQREGDKGHGAKNTKLLWQNCQGTLKSCATSEETDFCNSLYANPKHNHCPPGATSWCFWQRDLAKCNSPGSHKAHATLSSDVVKKMVTVFQRLANEDLLKRSSCESKQNSNESFHSVV